LERFERSAFFKQTHQRASFVVEFANRVLSSLGRMQCGNVFSFEVVAAVTNDRRVERANLFETLHHDVAKCEPNLLVDVL